MMMTSNHRKKIIELVAVTSPRRTVLTLQEAAVRAACSVDDLLLQGIRGELQVCARIPKDYVVYSTNKALIELADPTLTGLRRKQQEEYSFELSAQAERDIQMVVLSKSDCESVIAQGEVYQSLFAAGVRMGAAGGPVVLEPPTQRGPVGMMDMRPFRVFGCYPSTVDPNNWTTRKTLAPACLNITIDMMRVLVMAAPEDVADEPVRFDIGFVAEAYMPRMLVKLYDVAMLHWDCSRPGWVPPEDNNVERSLRELDEYKVKQAKAGATFLRRSFEHWNQKYYEKLKAEGKLTEFEALVVVASAWRPSDDSSSDTTHEFVKYRDKAIAFEFWKSIGILEYRAKYAWRIVAPKSARKTGRPRSE